MKKYLVKIKICDRLEVERKKKKMKTKIKIKFDINETIKRLEEISKGYQESAKRMEKLIVKLDEIENLKKG